MSENIIKVLNNYQIYKERTAQNTRERDFLYKYLNDHTLDDLDISNVEEYLVRMEKIRNDKQERNEIMKEELGGVLYVYAIQNEDYDLLDELLENNIDLKYAVNQKVHRYRPNISNGVYKSLIYVIAETYILKQEYDQSYGEDLETKHYEFSGPLCNNLNNEKLVELLKILMIKNMKKEQLKLQDVRILKLWSADEDETFGYEMKLQNELLYSILKEYKNYVDYAREIVAKKELENKLPKEVINHIIFHKNGKGKGKKSNKKKSKKKSKKPKKRTKKITL